MEEEVRAKLRAAVGDATPPALRFAAGPVPSPGEDDEPPRATPSPSAEDEALAEALTAAIDDAELRDAVRRAAAASLAAARDDRGI
jgi:hypothetical protein